MNFSQTGYRVAVQLCGYFDVVGAIVCWINRSTKFCDGCITVCIYRIGILVIANADFLFS